MPHPIARSCIPLLAALAGRLLLVLAGAAWFLVLSVPALPVMAQALRAELYVNDSAITSYEIEQRQRFHAAIGLSDDRALAIERLIEDRLQVQEARRLGVRLPPEAIVRGMEEFAARAELSLDEFLVRLAEAGVERNTFVEFVRAGLLWREVARGLFVSEIRITNAEVERALSLENVRPRVEIQISEIFLPSDPRFADAVEQLIPQILALSSEQAFAAAARQVSIAATAQEGGRLAEWIALDSLPLPLREVFAVAEVGQVLGPVEVPQAIGFFLLRARRETRDVPAQQIELEFREAYLPGGRSPENEAALARIRARAERCVDFDRAVFEAVPGLGPDAVVTRNLRQEALSPALALELLRLNPGDVAASRVENGALVVVQLCARRVLPEPPPSREEIDFTLLNQKLEERAALHLARLKSEAEIRRR